MGKFRLPTNSFLLGEVSSKFYGRYDIREISQACRNLLNSFVRPQGGSFRRPGSRFVTHQGQDRFAAAKTFAEPIKLIQWNINQSESYVIIFADYDAASTTPEVLNVFRVSSEAYATISYNDGNFTASTFTLTSSQVKDIKYAQFNDLMICVHPNHYPVAVYRLSSSKFGYSSMLVRTVIRDFGGTPLAVGIFGPSAPNNLDWYNTIPFLDINKDPSATLTPSATTGTITLTSSVNFFTASHVTVWAGSTFGARFRLFDASTGKWGICELQTVVDATHATARVAPTNPMGSTAATNVWQESAWSDARGWPRTVGFYQNRVVYGGNTSFPNALWFSQLDDIYEMARPVSGANDNDAFTFNIGTGELNAIQWLSVGKTLIVGTSGEEIIVSGTDPNEAISNSNISASPETGYGSEYVRPIRIDNALLFVQRSGLKVREFQFNLSEDAYTSRDLNRFADHMGLKAYDYYASVTIPKIIEIVYQGGDNPIIYTLDNNGVVNALMRDKESNGLAWTPLKLGGKFGSGTEPPVVLSMCAVTSINGLDDELWLYVKRTINSATVYFIERITREFFGTGLAQSSASSSHFYPYYLDCAINQTLGAPGTGFNGYTRLNGDTVHVIADGNYIGTKVVGASSSNTITLASNATTITAGYTYQSIVSPILPDVGSVIGTAIGAVRRINDIAIRFRRTVAAKFGRTTSANDVEEIVFRPASVSTSLPIPLFDGIKRRSFNGEYDRDPQIYIYQDDPLPMEVTSFSADGVTYD